MRPLHAVAVGVLVGALTGLALGQPVGVAPPMEQWVDATGRAAGTGDTAQEEAKAKALRTAVEETCGVFLTAQSKTRDYKAVYDKVFANAVGYVREFKIVKTEVVEGVTLVRVRALVSTRKFEEDWASIAHTLEQENNPRVIVAIVESVYQTTSGPTYEVKEDGIVQTTIEEFLLSKGLTLMDRSVAADIAKRDVLLAAIKDDATEMAALGSRFKADVVVTGKANVKFGKTLEVAGQEMYQYVATLNVRVIQTDSARVLATKSFPPYTHSTLQRGGGEDKALAEMAKRNAPVLLAAVIEAWKNRANVSRTVQLSISGMDYATWKVFEDAASKIPGVQAVRLREITEGIANIDVEYQFTNETLADRLTELKALKLTVQEITPNRLKLKAEPAPLAPSGASSAPPGT
ncbi:MAG: hypothetical protein MUP47_05465 [Phycisphaerae bacterium]|nr:hypothetical protein [Phycisphaerae bacterium]